MKIETYAKLGKGERDSFQWERSRSFFKLALSPSATYNNYQISHFKIPVLLKFQLQKNILFVPKIMNQLGLIRAIT